MTRAPIGRGGGGHRRVFPAAAALIALLLVGVGLVAGPNGGDAQVEPTEQAEPTADPCATPPAGATASTTASTTASPTTSDDLSDIFDPPSLATIAAEEEATATAAACPTDAAPTADPDGPPGLNPSFATRIATPPPTAPPTATPVPPTETPVPPTATAVPTETPAPTDTPAPTATPLPPTASPTPPPTATPPPAPTATPAPTETAAPTATVAFDPAGEVAVALPPADIPTTNEQGYTFALDATLSTGFEGVPLEAVVYRLRPVSLDLAGARALAERLAVGAEVEDRGDGTFAAAGPGGQLFVTADLVQYLAAAPPAEGALPGDGEAVEVAREWLRAAGLTQPDLGAGRVASRSDAAGRVVVIFGPVEPAPVLAAYPSITVALGPGGATLEASSRWARIERAEVYALRPAEEGWRQVEGGRAYVETDLSEADFPPGAEIRGSVQYERIGLAYTTGGPPGGDQYLQPVFVFEGRLMPEGGDAVYPLRAYVPALASSTTPVGWTGGGTG